MTDKHNLMNEYRNEFESHGVLALSVWKYMSFGIFLFQISMARIFITIIKGDLLIASVIVIAAEIFFIVFFIYFKVPDYKEIISHNQEITAKTLINDEVNTSELSDAQKEKLRNAYLHPFE